jgi:hypothetical protein
MKESEITAYRINLINLDSSGQITKITFRNFLLLPVVPLKLLHPPPFRSQSHGNRSSPRPAHWSDGFTFVCNAGRLIR